MKKKLAFVLFLFCLGMVAACGKKGETTDINPVSRTPEPFNTVSVQPTVIVKATNTPTITNTPTDTPTPTATNTPTPTPTFTLEQLETVTTKLDEKIPFVMIDPGHGGGDPGACADSDGDGKNDVYEQKINLSIALKVAYKLIDKGVQVALTRSTDKKNPTYIEKDYTKKYPNKSSSSKFNYFRKDFSDASEVDLFISIHQNSSSSTKAKGCEVWRTLEFNENSGVLAKKVFDSITKQLGYSKTIVGDNIKGNEAKNLIVLQTLKPSIMVECGYMSNAEELLLLISDEFQEKIADGIVEGIIAYYKEMGLYPDFDFGEKTDGGIGEDTTAGGNQP